MNFDQLQWECIYFHDEHDTDGSLITSECVQEAKYKNGYLIRHFYEEMKKDFPTTVSITYIPIKE